MRNSYLFTGIIFLILLLNTNISFAEEELPFINMPDEFTIFQTVPLEIYIPQDLRENITKLGFWSYDCKGPYLNPFVKQGGQAHGNYSGQEVISYTAFFGDVSNQEKNSSGSCTFNINFFETTKSGTDKLLYQINKTVTINPTDIDMVLSDREWNSKKWNYKSNADDFRGGTTWNFENSNVECGLISEKTVGIRTNNIDIKYGYYDYELNPYMMTRNPKLLEEYFMKKTVYYETDYNRIKYESHISEPKLLSLPGYENAYYRELYWIDNEQDQIISYCFQYHILIYAVKETGQVLKFAGRAYGRLNSEEEDLTYLGEFKDEMIKAASTIKLKETAFDFESLIDTIKDEPKEEKDIKKREYKINIKGSNSKEIWNTGRINTGEDDPSFQVLLNVDITAYDEDGKKIKNPTNDDLYRGVKVVAKLKTVNESQIGFNSDLSKEFKRSVANDLELIDVRGKGPTFYKGIYKPQEIFEVYLEENGQIVTDKLEFYVTVKDGSPMIILDKPIIEVQDGDVRVFKLTIKDYDKSDLKCSAMVPTDYAMRNKIPYPALSYEGKTSSLINFNCKDGDTIKIIYNAPKFGNFDLSNELNALSMWKMQENTMMTLATDTVGLLVGGRLDVLEEQKNKMNQAYKLTGTAGQLKNAQNVQKTINTLSKANDLSTDTQNLIKLTQMNKNSKDLANQLDKAIVSGKQGWLEWGSEWGIYGIDVAQSTVGAVAMAPGKIPVIGPLGKKLGGGFSLVFNLATNVWKGNLQYLSQVEKINRAKEMKFPYPIIITVEDQDGFETKDVQNVIVVYNVLE